MNIDRLPPPYVLGLNKEKFKRWREDQEKAITDMLKSEKRFIMQVLPTGSGKTVIYVAGAIVSGMRTLFLTSTRGLQNQLSRDFGSMDEPLVTVMGKENYRCRIVTDDNISCDKAPCNFGFNCDYRQHGCYYWDTVKMARNSRLVSTNYAYWMHNEGILGDFDMIVCDEAHSIIDNILGMMSVSFERDTCPITWVENTENVRRHIEWLIELRDYCSDEIKRFNYNSMSSDYELKYIMRLHTILNRSSMLIEYMSSDPDNWVVDYTGDKVTYDPIWPKMAEDVLFRGTKKVLLVSATVSPKLFQILGIDSDFDHIEYPNRFQVSRRPVYYIPTARIDIRSNDMLHRNWITRHDQIIRKRLDRKGIIHAVSYERCNMIKERSTNSDVLMTHTSRNANKVIEAFRKSKPPAVLVSPCVFQGYDFPYDQCEYQIISKVPFQDGRSKVEKKRREEDKQYSLYCVVQTIVQAVGRGMRAPDDQCETFIVDDHAKWLLFTSPTKDYAPKWFLGSLRSSDVIPDPIPKLVRCPSVY